MEFFNCRTKSFHNSNGEHQIVSVEYKKLQKYQTQTALFSMDGVYSLGLFSIINHSPFYVSLVGKRSNHIAGCQWDYNGDLTPFGVSVVRTLENFNIPIDIGRLNRKSRCSVIKQLDKPFVLTDAVLSSFCDNFALNPEEEAIAVENGALIIVNVDKFNVYSLAGAIKKFIIKYGGSHLAISSWQNKKLRVEKLISLLKEDGVSSVDIDALAIKNAERFFFLSNCTGGAKFFVDKTDYL